MLLVLKLSVAICRSATVYAVALMEDRFVFFVSTDLFRWSFLSEDLWKPIFDGGFKFIETVLCNPSFPAGDTVFMGLSSETPEKFREYKTNNTRIMLPNNSGSNLRLNFPEARWVRGTFFSRSSSCWRRMDFHLITKKASIAPRTTRDITIPATPPPPTFLLPPSLTPTLPPLLPLDGLFLLSVEWLLLLSVGFLVGDGRCGGVACGVAGLLLKEFPLVLQ